MADVKWIKITTDIFDDEKILLIESLPEAYAIITCWFKLLCLAGKQNNRGVFLMNDKIAYTDKMLATIFRMKETTVQLALKTFEEFGMIELVDGVITIPNWSKHQNLDQLEERKEYMRNYMADYRAKQKQIAYKVNSKVNSKVNVSPLDIDIDKELDIDKSKSKRFIKPMLTEVENYIEENNLNVNAQTWYDYYESNGFMVGRNHMKDWKACVRRWSNTNEKPKEKVELPKYEYSKTGKLSREEIEEELRKAGKL